VDDGLFTDDARIIAGLLFWWRNLALARRWLPPSTVRLEAP
jgi:hypothetical protein